MLIKRVTSAYLFLVALAVAVQFNIWTVYAQASDRANDTAVTIWNVLGWCQLAGLVIALVTTFKAKRHHDTGAGAPTRQWLAANLLFYGALVLTLAFLPNWLAARWGDPPDESTFWSVWYVIDTLVPVVLAVEALRIWRTTRT